MHGAKDHFDPTPPPLRLVGGPDDYDALAELFLGGEPRASRRVGPPAEPPRPTLGVPEDEPAPRPQVVVIPQSPRPAAAAQKQSARAGAIEALILGHLPVRSSPWVSQYARARAEQLRRAVCLVRVQADHASLDIFGSAGPVTPQASLDQAIDAAGGAAQDWIVQVDELNEPALAADDRLTGITLLTSANETAVIAAYRAIKGLASAHQESGAHLPTGMTDSDGDSPQLRVGIMGATPDEAQAAMARLRNACSVFLGKPLELAASVERVGPTSSASMYRGLLTMDLPSILARIASLTAPSATKPAAHAPGTAKPVRPSSVAPTEATPPSNAAHSLASHVPGLRSLAARCPDDASIELAIDAKGLLHVLKRAESPDCCQRLIAATGWAARHAALIALTLPADARLECDSAPIAHLFVGEPKAYRTMIDSSVRLHLLAQTASPWVCMELN